MGVRLFESEWLTGSIRYILLTGIKVEEFRTPVSDTMVFSSHVSMQCPWRLLAVIASFLWLLPDSKQGKSITQYLRLVQQYTTAAKYGQEW